MLFALSFALLVPQQPAAPPAITATLAPPPADSKGLRWSPKGATVPLLLQDGVLVGSFPLGHRTTPPVAVQLAKSPGAERFDQLRIDLDRDGRFGEGELLTCTPKEQRGKWWSSFAGDVQVPLADGKSQRAYPMNLWFVEDPREPEAKPALRWSRRGFVEGQVEIGGKPAFVLMTEMNMDGVFDQRDAWALARTREQLLLAASRSLEGHAWLDGVAYRATAIDADGLHLLFASFDPGFTEAEEKQKADTTAVDRQAKRAAQPLQFGKDLTAALATARREGKRVFVDFQTTWCGPCRAMEQWVYSAQAVVDAAAGCVPVVLDGDDERELVKRFKVSAYPTMLLLDGEGKELARAVGYRSVAEMAVFLRGPE